MWAVLDEAALRRPIGTRQILRAQLRHLVKLAEPPNITLQVLPLDVGGHSATGGGAGLKVWTGRDGVIRGT
jgi:hypothetical protein